MSIPNVGHQRFLGDNANRDVQGWKKMDAFFQQQWPTSTDCVCYCSSAQCIPMKQSYNTRHDPWTDVELFLEERHRFLILITLFNIFFLHILYTVL